MEKVFLAYNECFKNVRSKKEKKLKKFQLPIYFEKFNLDKRIQKRLIEVEKIQKMDSKKVSNKPKNKNRVLANRSETDSTTNERIFYRKLHVYLEENYNNNRAIDDQDLREMYNRLGKTVFYMKSLKKLYKYKLSTQLSLDEICSKYGIVINKKDRRGLSQYW